MITKSGFYNAGISNLSCGVKAPVVKFRYHLVLIYVFIKSAGGCVAVFGIFFRKFRKAFFGHFAFKIFGKNFCRFGFCRGPCFFGFGAVLCFFRHNKNVANVNIVIIRAYAFFKHNSKIASHRFIKMHHGIALFSCLVKKPFAYFVNAGIRISRSGEKGRVAFFKIRFKVLINKTIYKGVKFFRGMNFCKGICLCFCFFLCKGAFFIRIHCGIIAEVYGIKIFFVFFVICLHFLFRNLYCIVILILICVCDILEFCHIKNAFKIHALAVHKTDVFFKGVSVFFRNRGHLFFKGIKILLHIFRNGKAFISHGSFVNSGVGKKAVKAVINNIFVPGGGIVNHLLFKWFGNIHNRRKIIAVIRSKVAVNLVKKADIHKIEFIKSKFFIADFKNSVIFRSGFFCICTARKNTGHKHHCQKQRNYFFHNKYPFASSKYGTVL